MTGLSLSSLFSGGKFIPIWLSQDGRISGDDTGAAVSNDRDLWCVIAPVGVRLHPGFQNIFFQAAPPRPDVDIFYGDEVALRDGGKETDIFLKPALDLTLLIADDYVGVPLIVRASALHRLGGLRPEAGTAAAYDLLLRAKSAGIGIARITEILAAHPGSRPHPDIADRSEVLRRWLANSREPYDVRKGRVPGTLRLQRRFDPFPEVTLIVPTRQSIYEDSTSGQPFVIELLENLGHTDWPMEKIQVLVGDAIEDERIYSGRRWPFRFRRMVVGAADNRVFNYAAKANVLWRAAETEHFVLVNDDISFDSPDWLQALLTFSMQEDVGIVGARLLYPDGTLQHAGIPGGLLGVCAHAWLGQSASIPTYQNWAIVHREWSMMTGAILASRKSVMELVDGFDEQFRLEYNDVDLCLRLRMLGYRNVYTPFAELTHYEKASRGQLLPRGNELALFLKRWGEYLERDPAYHPRLDHGNFEVKPVEQLDAWW